MVMRLKYLRAYYEFLDLITRDGRFLANVRHPEAGWRVGTRDLAKYLGVGKARLTDFAIACRLRGFAVDRVGDGVVIIRREPLRALLQLLERDSRGRLVVRMEFVREFEVNTGFDAMDLLRRAGYGVSIDGGYLVVAGSGGGDTPSN